MVHSIIVTDAPLHTMYVAGSWHLSERNELVIPQEVAIFIIEENQNESKFICA